MFRVGKKKSLETTEEKSFSPKREQQKSSHTDYGCVKEGELNFLMQGKNLLKLTIGFLIAS